MTKLITAVTSFLDIVMSLVSFVIDLVQSLVEMAAMLAVTLVKLPIWIAYFYPSELVAGSLVILGVAVTYKILGREG